jgi:hypothetical protein
MAHCELSVALYTVESSTQEMEESVWRGLVGVEFYGEEKYISMAEIKSVLKFQMEVFPHI